MGVKNFWNKLVGTVGGVNEDDDEFETDEAGYEDEVAPRQTAQPYRSSSSLSSAQQEIQLKMMIVEPETFDDAQNIADYLRERKPVVINFEATEPDITKRVVDFVSGATYAVDGNIQKVGKDIFLCVPSNVSVDRGKHEYDDFASALTWKNQDGQ